MDDSVRVNRLQGPVVAANGRTSGRTRPLQPQAPAAAPVAAAVPVVLVERALAILAEEIETWRAR
jgi:hypothetical protein